ncbi:hypothetical protein ANANG_G00150540 [Anguilla anguilla]|uniref:PDZ domain-containing protein n=1 Tax=Anguilla anguilla TaxID=7936 RepID=A0A9D3RVQ4_ANGAN|nr:hypothetical protein ANANG_G00150540 [Anguilla anguilla]
MFHLIKKDKDKDGARKEKKDKKDKKERMSQAELKSLEEMSMRRGFFQLHRGSSKRDQKGKLEISSPIPIKVASSTELSLTDIDSDGQSNRGSVALDAGQLSTASSCDDLKGDGPQDGSRSSVRERAAKFGSLTKQSSQPPQAPRARPAQRVRVPEVVDRTFAADLRLPAVVAPQMPDSRELELQRRNTGDFGFSLRRTTMLDRGADGAVYRRVVHFAEPGAGAGTKDLALGLVPGDRLVEINGRNVESKSRDEIVETIRQSGDTVRLKVQPILELSELSRCWLRSGEGLRREASDAYSGTRWVLGCDMRCGRRWGGGRFGFPCRTGGSAWNSCHSWRGLGPLLSKPSMALFSRRLSAGQGHAAAHRLSPEMNVA